MDTQVHCDRIPNPFAVCLYDEQLPASRPGRLGHLTFADGAGSLH